MQKTVKLRTAVLIAVLASILVGTTVAAILMTRTINNTMRMLGAANFKLVREDDLTEVSTITWGDFVPLQSKDSQTLLGTRILIYNIGNVGLVFSWNATGYDRARWSLTCTSGAEEWEENSETWLWSIASGCSNGYLTFFLESLDPYHPPEDSTFTVSIYAHPMP